MKRRIAVVMMAALAIAILGACSKEEDGTDTAALGLASSQKENVTQGEEEYRGFLLNNVLHSEAEGEIHYNVYVPGSYDGTKPYALFFTLPGYEGLYFQGVGANLRSEEIDRLLVLDIKDSSYFERQGVTNQHGGGGALFSHDDEIMGWLFGK